MDGISRWIVVIIAAVSLYGCAASQPYMGSGGYARVHGYGGVSAGYANVHTPYMGMYGGRCYYHGFVQPTNDPCLSGQAMARFGNPAAYGQMQSVAPAIGGMSPEMATELLAELDRQPNPCTVRESTTRTMIGTAIGAVVGAVIGGGRNHARGAIVGGLIGAAGGNSSADWTCQRYTDTKLALRATIDAAKPRCRDGLHEREVDGRLMTSKTRDCSATEARDFDRIGENRPATRPRPVRMERQTSSSLPE
ncbi:MAG: glycine zipper 2TM domain-containing protein [Candidatus Moraniibacteriota bacterium]|nr:MAG: glycine zipper 2TM domain-containing protein [Candidatus Moranbacteria bacterium]